MEAELEESLARELGCGVGKVPFSYLGLPIGRNPRSKSFWNPIIERVDKKLKAWSKHYMS